MHVQIDPKSNIPIWEQIVQKTKESILLGILQSGDKLPSVRDLASQLLVNPNTVSKAYQELERQGVIETIRGKGTFIAERLEPSFDQRKVDQLKEKLRQLVIEANYNDIDLPHFQEWVKAYWEELGGENHATDKESK